MPDRLIGEDCPDCGGSGESPRAKYLHALRYGNVPFRPEDNGSTPFTPDHPVIRARAEWNVERAPEYYLRAGITTELGIRWEAERLAEHFNNGWLHHLNEKDVAALIEAGRLRDLTHTFDPVNRWQPIDPPVTPTPEQVNEWSLAGFGHGSINAWVCVRERCKREGVPQECARCEGHGSLETYPGQRADADAWERNEPPTGEGWQMWQTVSDAPLSPVFATAEELIEWMTTPDAEWGAVGPWSRENAEAFVRGPGWAPTFVGGIVPGLLVDGVTAVVS